MPSKVLTHGSLFTGIGGFDLGFERAGIKTIWQVECDPYALKVLEKHWPDVPRYTDIRTVEWGTVPRPDILSGGFPCQDISHAGKRAGITGSRSGLWVEFRRAIVSLRPRVVVVENVAALYQRGLDRVLGDLAESGYDAEWDCLPAAAVGAPHLRERIWIIAYPVGSRRVGRTLFPFQTAKQKSANPFAGRNTWLPEPAICGVDDGLSDGLVRYAGRGTVGIKIPHRKQKLQCLGNAVVPQLTEAIGRMILEASQRCSATGS